MDTYDHTFQNLINYTDWRRPFVDGFSQFAVTFTEALPFGVGPLYPKATQGVDVLLDATLSLWIDAGTPISVKRNTLDSYPWLAIEHGSLRFGDGQLLVKGRHTFKDHKGLRSEFVLTNDSNRALTFSPCYEGSVSRHRFGQWSRFQEQYPETCSPHSYARAGDQFVEAGHTGIGKFTDVPCAQVRIREVSRQLQTGVSHSPLYARQEESTALEGGEQSIFYRFHGEQVTLAPGASMQHDFVLDYAVAWFQQPEVDLPPHPSVTDMMPFDELVQQNKTRFLQEIDYDSISVGHSVKDAYRVESRYKILRTGYRGDSAGFDANIATLCRPGLVFSTAFFWDSLFTAVAIADFHPEFAKGAIRSVFSDLNSHFGVNQENTYDYRLSNRDTRWGPQAPIASWATARCYQTDQDLGFVNEMLPYLEKNHAYWNTFCDADHDGLAEWSWSGQTADDSPIYDKYKSQEGGCTWLPPVASVSLNSFLYKDAMHLADLHELLGNHPLAAEYRDQAQQRFERFMEICYCQEDRRFYDYNHNLQRFEKTKSFYLFWPMFADMPILGDLETELIEDVLLNPDMFNGVVPFPSMAYDEADYSPTGYWRGKAWPHISYWLLETLARKGYGKQADTIADRFLAWQSYHGLGRENICTDPGHLNTSNYWDRETDYSYENGSHFDYNWGNAAVYLIASGMYRQGV